jgi:hypothetical protein
MDRTQALTQDVGQFCFERFGRYVAPDAIDDWLRKPGLMPDDPAKGKTGKRSPSPQGTSIFISASRVVVFGHDFRDLGFPSAGDVSEMNRFLDALRFEEPSEPWLFVSRGKAAITLDQLRLNIPGMVETAYFTRGALQRFRPGVLRQIHRMLGNASAKDIARDLPLALGHVKSGLSASDAKKFNKLDPDWRKRLSRAAHQIAAHGIDMPSFKSFIVYQENRNV